MRAALEDLHIRPPGQLADARLPGMAGNRLPFKMARMSPGCGGYSPAEKGHPLFLPRGCPFSIVSIVSIVSIAVSSVGVQGTARPLYTDAVISCRRFRLYSRGQRAKRTCLHVHLATAARVKYPAALLRYKFDAP